MKNKKLTRSQIGQTCELYANGWSISDIARGLGKDRNTITKALDSNYRMKYKDMAIVVIESSINKFNDNSDYQ